MLLFLYFFVSITKTTSTTITKIIPTTDGWKFQRVKACTIITVNLQKLATTTTIIIIKMKTTIIKIIIITRCLRIWTV